MKRKIIDARADKDGDITSVTIQGNKRFTPIDRAIEMAKRGEIENVHVSKTGVGKEYLRSNRGSQLGKTLDDMAGDT